MSGEFLLPDPGEGIYEAEILDIHVSLGDDVKDGDPLFTVETDKAVVEIPSSFDGRIVDIQVEAGDIVEVGSVLLTYESAVAADQKPAVEDDVAQTQERGATEVKTAGRGKSQRRPGGPDRPVPASPATRSLAKRLGVDIQEIEGSGPGGRIEPGDVQAAAEGAVEEKPEEPSPPDAEERDLPDFTGYGPVEWIDLRSVRRATARHMTRSWERIPHVTHHDMADITDLESFRQTRAGEVEEAGGKLTITVFLVKAVIAALAEHPRFNASLDDANDRLALKGYYNIGVAVDTDDGLVVPVIKEADRKSMLEIAVELTELAERMRRRDRTLQDMQGGTFTITNPGGIGGTGFNPIINHPEVAILGAARASQVPVVTDVTAATGEADRTFDVTPRLHLPLVLAFDHRVNDGADAARFMNTVIEMLEDPTRLLLHA